MTALTIATKEWKGYFTTPIAYVVLTTFVVLCNWFFFRFFFVAGQTDLRPLFSLMPWFLLFFVPAIAMGMWAEERKFGTMELLLTLPIRDRDAVIGKFLGGLFLIISALALTLPIPITVSFLGNLDWGPVVGGYVGLILLSSAYLAVGLFLSSLTQNQIVAFILGIVSCFILYMVGEPLVTGTLPAGLAVVVEYLGLGVHFESIARGVVDSRDILYFASVIGFFLWANWRVIETRR